MNHIKIGVQLHCDFCAGKTDLKQLAFSVTKIIIINSLNY